MTAAEVAIPVPESPFLIWLGIIITAAIAVASAFPKVAGPLAEGWEKVTDSARRTAIAKDDADVADLKRQVEHLTVQVGLLRRDIVHRDAFLSRHAAWDALVRVEAAKVGLDLPPPPSLWPVVDDPVHPYSSG